MSDDPSAAAYRVLARKYRPKDFDTLIGQEALVRILTNAINSGRIAQAFMLTGVRGVGKTTTARIIAKALNCIGPDGGADRRRNPAGNAPTVSRSPRTGMWMSRKWTPPAVPAWTRSAN